MKNLNNTNENIQEQQITELIKLALEGKFDDSQLSSILDVINMSQNRVVTTLILLGKFEEPKFQKTLPDMDPKVDIKFDHYDSINDRIHYSYLNRSYREAWFKKDTEKVEENIVSTSRYSGDAAKELEISREELIQNYTYAQYNITINNKISNDYMSSDRWIKKSKNNE